MLLFHDVNKKTLECTIKLRDDLYNHSARLNLFRQKKKVRKEEKKKKVLNLVTKQAKFEQLQM